MFMYMGLFFTLGDKEPEFDSGNDDDDDDDREEEDEDAVVGDVFDGKGLLLCCGLLELLLRDLVLFFSLCCVW